MRNSLTWIIFILSLISTTAIARCLAIDDGSHPCRYPAGDSWCDQNDRSPYAYRSKCNDLPFPSHILPGNQEVSNKVLEDSSESGSLPYVQADYQRLLKRVQEKLNKFLVKNIKEGNYNAVYDSIKQGADVNYEHFETRGTTPLMYGAYKGDLRIIKLLLSNGSDVNKKREDGITALISASYQEKDDPSVSRILLDHGADVNARNNDGVTALMKAAHDGKRNIVKLLLEFNCNLNATTYWGTTAINSTAKEGHFEIVQMLLDAGADPYIEEVHKRNNAIDNAKTSDVISLFGRYGYTKQKKARFSEPALYIAIRNRDISRIKELINSGANVNALIDRNYGKTILMGASELGRNKCIELLLDAGANINAKEIEEGATALMYAIQGGNANTVKLLLNRGADVNVRPIDGRSALIIALDYSSGKTSIVQMLIDNGADVNSYCRQQSARYEGFSPLLLSVKRSYTEIAKILLDNGALVNHQGDWLETPLYVAASDNNLRMAELLLKKGAMTNRRNYDFPGKTPLMVAAENGFSKMVRLLLQYDADVLEKDKKEKTALDYAKNDHIKIIMRSQQKKLGLYDPAMVIKRTKQVTSFLSNNDNMRKLEQVSLSHYSRYGGDVAFSQDCTLVAAEQNNESIGVWDTSTGKRLFLLLGHEGPIEHIVFSDDSRLIASTSWDKTARIWSAQNGDQLQVLRGHTGWVTHASFSTDGKHIVTSSNDATAKIWNTSTGNVEHTLKGHTTDIYSTAFSDFLVATSTIHKVSRLDIDTRVWNSLNGKVQFILRDHTDSIRSTHINAKVKRLVTTSEDGTARLYDLYTGENIAVLRHAKGVWWATFNSNAMLLATTSQDTTVRIWSSETGVPVSVLDGHYKGSVQAFFIKGGLYVVTTDRAGTARLWETLTGRRLKVLDLDDHEIWTACQPQNNNKIMTLDKNGFVVTVDVSSVYDIRSTDLSKQEINKHLALVAPNIFIASENGDQKIVESLLASGTDLNVRDEEGQTPLFFAASNGKVLVAELLLRKGADPNIPNVNGATPLQLAAANGKVELVRLLLKYGADPNIGTGAYPNGTGETGPLYWARRYRRHEIVEILIDAGAK